MKIPKDVADRMAREFRASLNKAAKEGIIYQSYFQVHGAKCTIHFAVEVRKDSGECACWEAKG